MKKTSLLEQFKAKNRQKENRTLYICDKKPGTNTHTLRADKARLENAF